MLSHFLRTPRRVVSREINCNSTIAPVTVRSSPRIGEAESSIERVVNNHKLSVRKQCLERANSDKSSTKVVANITIGPSGNVQSVSASGDDPVAAKCVENQIRGWQFPAPGETKQVQVPFTFVRQ